MSFSSKGVDTHWSKLMLWFRHVQRMKQDIASMLTSFDTAHTDGIFFFHFPSVVQAFTVPKKAVMPSTEICTLHPLKLYHSATACRNNDSHDKMH